MDAQERISQLERLYLRGCVESNGQMASIESLLDVLLVLHDECAQSTLCREKNFAEFVEALRPAVERVKTLRLHRDDFETVKIIGRGAFGEVHVVREKGTNKIYAMKLLNKWEMLRRRETACFREERDVLVFGNRNWITALEYAFQDDNYLYLVMEYYSGGDLLTLLAKHEDHLPEDMAKFYLAEMVLCVHSIHTLGYVHRDVKPDNFVINRLGHVRLADFGSCMKLREDGTVNSSVAVGTPDYISPEILQAMEAQKGVYGTECDWWSLGICFYEMVFGETPFYAESLVGTYGKIMNFESSFQFPEDVDEEEISPLARDLIRKLVCDKASRLGQKGIDDFKSHPFFEGIDWETLHCQTPPHCPCIADDADTSNFDSVDDKSPNEIVQGPGGGHATFKGDQLPFVGFTFTHSSKLSDLGNLETTKGDHTYTSSDGSSTVELEELRREKVKLQKELEEMKVSVKLDSGFPPIDSEASKSDDAKELGILRAEKEEMTLRVTDLEAVKSDLEGRLKEEDMRRDEMETSKEDIMRKMKMMEKSGKASQQEKEELERDVAELHSKMASLNKDMKDVQAQRRQLANELSDATDKLSDVREQKMKLQKMVREKEEEIEDLISKVSALRQEGRSSDKKRRELLSQVEELTSEVRREKTARQRLETRGKQLEEELQSQRKGRKVDPDPELIQEVGRLKVTLQQAQNDVDETVRSHTSKQSREIKELNGQISALESQNQGLQQENKVLETKLSKLKKKNLQEVEELIKEKNKRFEMEKKIWIKENEDLRIELDELATSLEGSLRTNRQLEANLQEALTGHERDSVTHWESQIAEIIEWVHGEKEARSYLHALSKKMAEELENIKSTGVTRRPSLGTWQNRKLYKQNKQQLLEVQAELNNQVKAKQDMQEDMTKVLSRLEASDRKLRDTELLNKDILDQLNKLQEEKEVMQKEMDRVREKGRVREHSGSSQGSTVSFRTFLTSTLNEEMPSSTAPGPSAGKATSEDSISTTSDTPPPASNSQAPPSSKLVMSPKKTMGKSHHFQVKTFVKPSKCNHCSSIMVGLVRQGMCCDVCHFSCHIHCADKVPSICPVHQERMGRMSGIDPKRGVGTACEGWVKIPKPSGVRKGWVRQYAVVCDFKLFLYDPTSQGEKEKTMNINIIKIIDMRDDLFDVSCVERSDVIHANQKQIPCIFKVMTSMFQSARAQTQLLVLTESAADQRKWVSVLKELRKLYCQLEQVDSSVYIAKEVYDGAQLEPVRMANCAVIVDNDRVLIGTEERLFTVELSDDTVVEIEKDKKVYQVDCLPDEQLVVALSGKQKHIRLYPFSALDGMQQESFKVTDTRGCLMFAWGSVNQITYLCAALRKKVIIFELNNSKHRYKKMKEFVPPKEIHWIGVFGDRVCIGYPSGFCLFTLFGEGQLQKLIHGDDLSLGFINLNPVDALCCVELEQRGTKEYLLCFNMLGVYVDSQGRRARRQELMWPSIPCHIAHSGRHLFICSENTVDVFDVYTAVWVQTMQIKKAKALCRDGSLMLWAGGDVPKLLFIKDKKTDDIDAELVVPDGAASSRKIKYLDKRTKSKRRFSFKQPTASQAPAKTEISNPINFSHVKHYGPDTVSKLVTRTSDQELTQGKASQPPSATRRATVATTSRRAKGSAGGKGGILNGPEDNLAIPRKSGSVILSETSQGENILQVDPHTGTFTMKTSTPSVSSLSSRPPPSHSVDSLSPIGESPPSTNASHSDFIPSDGEPPPPYPPPPNEGEDEEEVEEEPEDLNSPDGSPMQQQEPPPYFPPPDFHSNDDWGVEQDSVNTEL
eukprot:m.23006 g.23006  ORF g.23006 m.23006 type:complete len:1798 (+) comp28431_c0_seq1:171-5564(+)